MRKAAALGCTRSPAFFLLFTGKAGSPQAAITAYDGLSEGDELPGLAIVHEQLLMAGVRPAKIIDENF